ncbi:MAG TPA: hypothetical protein VK611_08510 [Acidimicrobiales bacterium]|nr:hypothetical protein [Acidimicrobiales bacterium]
MSEHTNPEDLVLVVGGTGKSGRRVAERLDAVGLPVRRASRSSAIPFDWEDPSTWAPVLEGATKAYVSYYPDLAFPGATEQIRGFAELAVAAGVRHLVLLSGRGEPEAVASEKVVQDAGADWTVVRCDWFAQNFSEGFLLDPVLAGMLALPAGDVGVPFVDLDDVADIATAALTRPGHAGELYEVTGPRLLTFADAAAELSAASGREIRYLPVTSEQFAEVLTGVGLPPEHAAALNDLFAEILDGRNANLADGVQRALGREPKDFTAYARAAAATGVWAAIGQEG